MTVEALVSPIRRIPVIWVVPLVALLLGIWMMIYTALNKGPEVHISFPTAEGIEAGKTRIRTLSVEIGTVISVTLSDDLKQVVVVAQLDKVAQKLLREDTRFWVVRPRLGAAGLTGLSTIVSGTFIELDPGEGEAGRRNFDGFDDVPLTPVGVPGIRLTLISEEAGFVRAGMAILYKEYLVGRIESTEFNNDNQTFRHQIFINAPYDVLVNDATRFWNVSGININAGADGVHIDVASLQSLLQGGVTFGVPAGRLPGEAVEDGAEFVLHPNYERAAAQSYRRFSRYIVEFQQSLRGLVPGAPVQYRGIDIGRVEKIMLESIAQQMTTSEPGSAIPVLIQIEPGRLAIGDTRAALKKLNESIASGVTNGLRATLGARNLLTGSLVVNIDYFSEAPPASLGSLNGYPVIPTIDTGLAPLQAKVSQLLDKLNGLPVEATLLSANQTLAELEGTVKELREFLVDDKIQSMPDTATKTMSELTRTLESFSSGSPFYEDLTQTLMELNQTLQGLGGLSATLDRQPGLLLFRKTIKQDPEPEVRP